MSDRVLLSNCFAVNPPQNRVDRTCPQPLDMSRNNGSSVVYPYKLEDVAWAYTRRLPSAPVLSFQLALLNMHMPIRFHWEIKFPS